MKVRFRVCCLVLLTSVVNAMEVNRQDDVRIDVSNVLPRETMSSSDSLNAIPTLPSADSTPSTDADVDLSDDVPGLADNILRSFICCCRVAIPITDTFSFFSISTQTFLIGLTKWGAFSEETRSNLELAAFICGAVNGAMLAAKLNAINAIPELKEDLKDDIKDFGKKKK